MTPGILLPSSDVKLINGSILLAVSLVRVLAPRLDSGEIVHRSEAINGVSRPAPEGVWVK